MKELREKLIPEYYHLTEIQKRRITFETQESQKHLEFIEKINKDIG